MAGTRGRHVHADPFEPSWSDSPFRAVTVQQTTGQWQLSVACLLSPALRAEQRTAEAAAWSDFLTHSALFNAREGV